MTDSPALEITPDAAEDWPEVWPILQAAFAAGESYPCPMNMSKQDAHDYWITTPRRTYVARRHADGPIVGTYYIRPDQGGLGDHVCNCGYVVAPAARSQGIGVRLCRHSQGEARRMGFRAMKFNLVVATNAHAVNAWRKCGMQIIVTAIGAFRRRDEEFVDAHIMYRILADPDAPPSQP